MALIRWIFAIGVLAMWTALIGTGLYVAMYEPEEEVPQAEAIVVLSGAPGTISGMNVETAARVARAVELYEEGAAPKIVMTGGVLQPDAAPIAEAMKAAAMEVGVPEEDILVETASQSTLQNALFVADMDVVDRAAPIILVSNKYHLPRANASFRWAGFSDVENVAADADGAFEVSEGLLWEAVKWPYNVVRAGAASAAMAGDVPRENYIKYLE